MYVADGRHEAGISVNPPKRGGDEDEDPQAWGHTRAHAEPTQAGGNGSGGAGGGGAFHGGGQVLGGETADGAGAKGKGTSGILNKVLNSLNA